MRQNCLSGLFTCSFDVNELTLLYLQLASFVDPRQAFGPDKIIPPEILANAKVRRELAPNDTSASDNLR